MASDRKLEIMIMEHKKGFRVSIANPPYKDGTYDEKVIEKIDHVAAWYHSRGEGAPILFHMPLEYQDKFWDTYSRMK